MQGIVEVLPINYCGLSVEVLPLGIELGVTAPGHILPQACSCGGMKQSFFVLADKVPLVPLKPFTLFPLEGLSTHETRNIDFWTPHFTSPYMLEFDMCTMST